MLHMAINCFSKSACGTSGIVTVMKDRDTVASHLLSFGRQTPLKQEVSYQAQQVFIDMHTSSGDFDAKISSSNHLCD